MGKSAKKSATKVDAVAPVVAVAPTKPLKKGKRDAEEIIEKKTNGKKQKKDIVEAIEKKKVEKKVVKKVSSSDDSSDESDDEPEVKVPAKKAPAPKDSSSEEESSSDDEPAVPAKKLPAKNGNAKKASSSSDESESESESDEDKAPVVKKVAAKKTESSDDSDEESSEDEKVTKNGTVKKAESSEEDSSEEESSDEEDATPAKKATPVTASKKKDESSSDDEDESSDDEMVDAEETKKQEPKTPTPKVQATEGGSKTLFVGNIAYSVEKSDVEAFFKDAGEVVDIRFATHPDGSFKGYGHVEFSTAEEAKKALELNGELLCGRDVRLDLANERGAYTPQTGGNERGSFQKAQSQTVFVKGFDVSEGEDQIRSALEEHFGSCGEITRVGIPTEADGTSKGIAYVDFKDAEGFNKALELNHSSLGNASLYVQEAKPRDSSGGGGGRRGGGRGDSGGRGFGRRGGRGDSGGRGFGGGGGRRGGRGDSGGRFGGGGGRRGGFNKPSMTPTGKKTTFE